MTLTAIATDDGQDRCATCGNTMPERSPNSPDVRYCETDWWAEQQRLYDLGEPVAPLALPVLQRRREDQP